MKQAIRHYVRAVRHLLHRSRNEPTLNPSSFDKVLFVAHPDDELLFFLNALLDKPGWLVVCMTNGGSAVRCREFLSLMAKLGHQRQIWNLKDGINSSWHAAKTVGKVSKVLGLRENWTMVATHNAEGEYGHPQHKQLHRIVRKAAHGHTLHVPTNAADLCSPENELPPEIMAKKRELLESCYPSQVRLVEISHVNWMRYERLVHAPASVVQETQ